MADEKMRSVCRSKRRYRTEDAAKLGIFWKATVTKLVPYKCPACSGWHITKNIEVAERWMAKVRLKESQKARLITCKLHNNL